MKIKLITHRNKNWISISLNYNDNRLTIIKKVEGRRWSQTNKAWLIPENEQNKKLIKTLVPKTNKKENSTNKSENKKEQTKTTILILKGNQLRISFYPTKKGIKYIKSLSLYRYNEKTKQWTIPFTQINLKQLTVFAEEQGLIVNVKDLRKQKAKPNPKPPNTHIRECPIEVNHKLIEMRYSSSTIKTYTNMLRQFFSHYYAFKPKEITNEQINAYLRYLIQDREVSESTQNQAINAIKFYYEKVLGGVRQTYYIERPRKSKYLPTVLSEKEILALLKASINLKHKTILTLIYSCGIRISEVLNIKLVDIDYDNMRIHIISAKGKKDRYVPLAKIAKKVIKVYIKHINPEEFLFEGREGGRYTATSIQKFIKKYAKAAGIKKNVTPHTLRHSFATHLLEKGTDLRYIQHILGHNNSKTTEIYTHITTVGLDKIKNPLDDFEFD